MNNYLIHSNRNTGVLPNSCSLKKENDIFHDRIKQALLVFALILGLITLTVAVSSRVLATTTVTDVTESVKTQTTEMILGNNSLMAYEVKCSRPGEAKTFWAQFLVVPGGVVFDPQKWCQRNEYTTVHSVKALLYNQSDWGIPVATMEKDWDKSNKYNSYTLFRGVVGPEGTLSFNTEWGALNQQQIDAMK